MATMLEVAARGGIEGDRFAGAVGQTAMASQETKDRVFKAVAESGYRLHPLAQPGDQNHANLGLRVTNTLYHGVYFSEPLYHVAR